MQTTSTNPRRGYASANAERRIQKARKIEPHLRLPLLSWFPRTLSNWYVRAAGKGDRYDCDPPNWKALRALHGQAKFDTQDVTRAGITLVADLECQPGLKQQLMRHAKLWAWMARGVLPTYLTLAQPRAMR